MQKNQTIIYIRLVIVMFVVFIISFTTYKMIRAYDNFVSDQQKTGYDRGYEQANKDLTKKSN